MNFNRILTAFALTLAASAAQAQDASHCVGIDDTDDRLDCFDDAFIQTATPPPPAGSQWRVSEERSRLDDSRSVYMALDSLQPVVNQYGQSRRLLMMLRCQENTTSAFIIWADHFMSDHQGKGRVSYRIDDRPAGRVNMTASTDNQALGLWNGGSAIPFIKRLFDGDELYVRATPFSESPVEAVFPITGVEDAIEPLREACNW